MSFIFTRAQRRAFCCAAILLSASVNAELTQEDRGDIDKVMQQRARATQSDRKEAVQWEKSAAVAVARRRMDLASKLYGEASLRYPTFANLRGAGDSEARSDRKRDTRAATLVAQHIAFVSAATTLRIAVLIAEKNPGEATPEQLASVRAHIACIDAYDGGLHATCEPVAAVLARVRAQKYP